MVNPLCWLQGWNIFHFFYQTILSYVYLISTKSYNNLCTRHAFTYTMQYTKLNCLQLKKELPRVFLYNDLSYFNFSCQTKWPSWFSCGCSKIPTDLGHQWFVRQSESRTWNHGETSYGELERLHWPCMLINPFTPKLFFWI